MTIEPFDNNVSYPQYSTETLSYQVCERLLVERLL